MQRVRQLDGLRGIAATQVMMWHYALLGSYYSDLLLNGASAVVLFFVLSGFCLLKSLLGVELKSRIWNFYARRVLRIYPAALATLALCCFGTLFYNGSALADTFMREWSHWGGWSAMDLFKYATLMISSDQYKAIDPPMWSLVIEMKISFAFPVIALAVFKVRRFWIRMVLFLAGAALALSGLPHASLALWPFVFFLGAMFADLSIDPEKMKPVWTRAFRALFLCAATLYFAAYALWGDRHYLPFVMVVAACAMTMIFLTDHYGIAAKFLTHPWIQYLGRISYAMYLVHFPIYMVVSSCALKEMGAWPTKIVSVALTLAIAEAMTRFIEIPCIRFGARAFSLRTAKTDAIS